jgi:anti-sigma B factor antagonist
MTPPVPVPADELFAVTVTSDGSSTVVTAAGEVDGCSAPRLATVLDSVVAGAAPNATVDLTAVTFLGSAGVHALAAAHRSATAVGARLRVLAARPAVVRPLQLTGLWPLLGADPAASPIIVAA